MHYIRIVRLIIFCLLLPLAVQAKREKVDMPDKPMVSDSILQCILTISVRPSSIFTAVQK